MDYMILVKLFMFFVSFFFLTLEYGDKISIMQSGRQN